jgi:acetyl esterase/lipase
MKAHRRTGRSHRTPRVALVLASLAGVAAALTVVPAPVFVLWAARLAVLELSLFAVALAALGIGLALAAREDGISWTALLVAVPALVVLIVPNLAAIPTYVREGVGFSVREYVFGADVAGITVERDLVLDPGRPQRADLYRPATAGPHPLVVVVHGGAWRGGDKGTAPHVSRALAAAGHAVLDVQYGLAPAHPFPEAVADVKCLLGRARERAAALGLDPARVAILGRSAGGQIALVAAYSAGDPRLPPACAVDDRPVSGVVALYAPSDLAAGYVRPVRPDVVSGPAALDAYLGGPPWTRAEAYRLATPQSWLERPLPEALLVHGAGDRLVHVGHSRDLAAALRSAGRPGRLLEIPYAEHGFDVRPGGVAEQLARGAVLDFLGRVLSRPSDTVTRR